MAKIIFTGEKIDDAISKVKSGYADVSKVTAKASDVRAGKKIVTKDKVEVIGTLADGSLTPSATVSSSYLSNTETSYPVVVTPSCQVNTPGVISEGKNGAQVKRYIQTETKRVTPSGAAQTITPTSGKLLEKVIVEKTPEGAPYPLQNVTDAYFYYYTNRATGSYTVCKFSNGTTFDNIYVRPGVDVNKARVYIFPIKTSSSSSTYFWGTANLIDSVTHRPLDTIQVLKPGDSFVSDGNNWGPKGVLTLTASGHLTFTFQQDWYCMSTWNASNENANYNTYQLFLVKGTQNYGLCIDATVFTHGDQRLGTKTTGEKHYTNRGLPMKPMVVDGYSVYSFEQPKTFLGNYAPVWFEWDYINDSTSYHLGTMTCGDGTGFTIIQETKKLNTPTPSISDNTISWPSVPEATGYYISITGQSSYTFTVSSTSYLLTNKISTAGTYYVSVRAYKSGVASDYSSPITYVYEKKLATPVISKSGTVVSWSAITNATGYYVYKNGTQWFSTSSISVNLASYQVAAGTYSIYVVAYASGWTNSANSNSVTYTVIAAPVLTLTEQGILSWNSVTGANYYMVKIDANPAFQYNSLSIDLNEYIDITESHTIQVAAYQSSEVYSSYSRVYTGSGDGRSFETAIQVNMTTTEIELLGQAIDDTNYPLKYYRLTVSTSGTYYIYTESSYDTYGILYDANQSQIAYNDDSGTGTNFSISYALTAGTTYYISVRQYSRNTCEYDLYINQTGPGPSPGPEPPEPEPEPIPYVDI